MTLLTFAPGALRRAAVGLGLAALVILLDQWSKFFVIGRWPEIESGRVAILPILDFVLRWNHGVSFSMGDHLGAFDRYLFAAIALLVSAFLALWMVRGAKPWILAALGLVVGGALGNTVDRLRFGAVEDFLYVHIGAFDWWPVFNLADSAICVGAAMMVFDSLFDRKVSHKNTP